jgi:hypothetical protein
MTYLKNRQILPRDILQARAAGSQLASACALAGLSPRTLRRWKSEEDPSRGDCRSMANRPIPTHDLREAQTGAGHRGGQRTTLCGDAASAHRSALADQEICIASESRFHRVMRAHGQMHRCGPARRLRKSKPSRAPVATCPGQVWCWGVSFSPSQHERRWFYLYLILDPYSRKIAGFEVHDTGTAQHAAHLARRTALAEGIHAMPKRQVLHGDQWRRPEGDESAAHVAFARDKRPPTGLAMTTPSSRRWVCGRRSSSVRHPAFRCDRRTCLPVPIWQSPSHGAQRRRWEAQSHSKPQAERPGARAWGAPDLLRTESPGHSRRPSEDKKDRCKRQMATMLTLTASSRTTS